MKNVDISRLGIMLYLDIQKGEEATNAETFQQQIRGTAVCTKRLILDTKRCGRLTSNYTYFDDIWVSRVKTPEDEMSEEVNCCGPVKKSLNGFFYLHYNFF